MATLVAKGDMEQADYGGLSDEESDTLLQPTANTTIQPTLTDIPENVSKIANIEKNEQHTNGHHPHTNDDVSSMTSSQATDCDNQQKDVKVNKKDEQKKLQTTKSQKETRKKSDRSCSNRDKLEEDEDEIDEVMETKTKTNKRKLSQIQSKNENNLKPPKKRQRREHKTPKKHDFNSIKAVMSEKSKKAKQSKTKISWNGSPSKRSSKNKVIKDSDSEDEDIAHSKSKMDIDSEPKQHKKLRPKKQLCKKKKDKNKTTKSHSKDIKQETITNASKKRPNSVEKSVSTRTAPSKSSESPSKSMSIPKRSKTERIPRRDRPKLNKSGSPTTGSDTDRRGSNRHHINDRDRDRDRPKRIRLHRDESKNDNLTGLWEQDRESFFVFYEDFRSGEIIGFMKDRRGVHHDDETVCHIGGKRVDENGMYHITQTFVDENRTQDLDGELCENYRKLKLNEPKSTKFWTLTLVNKRDIPPHYFHELEQLKRAQRFGPFKYPHPPHHGPPPYGQQQRYSPNNKHGHGHGRPPLMAPFDRHSPHSMPPYSSHRGPPYPHRGDVRGFDHRLPPSHYGRNGGPLPPNHRGYDNQNEPVPYSNDQRGVKYKNESNVANGNGMKNEKKAKKEDGKVKKEEKEKKKEHKKSKKHKSKKSGKKRKKAKITKSKSKSSSTSTQSPSPSLSPPEQVKKKDSVNIAPPDISPLLSPLLGEDEDENEVVEIVKKVKKRDKSLNKKKVKEMKKKIEKKVKEKLRRKQEKKAAKKEQEKKKAMAMVFDAVSNEFGKYKEKYANEGKKYKVTVKKCNDRVCARYKDKKSKYNEESAKEFLASNRNIAYIEKLVKKYVDQKDKYKKNDDDNDNDD